MVQELPVRIKKENSIKEAAITVFLASQIIKPERFKEVINDEALKGFFQQHQPIAEVTFKFGNVTKEPTTETNFKNDTGFKLLRFEKGTPTFAVQGVNEIDRTFFSFHNLNYKRWQDFKDTFKTVLSSLNKVQNDIFVNSISLHYVDEFIWNDPQDFDLSRIMKAEEFLPHNFIKIKGGHLSNTRELETKNKEKLYDRLEVLVSSSIEKTINISHNQTVLIANVLEFKNNESSNILYNLLDELHENNKELLRKILLQEVKNLIMLK